MWTMGYPAFIFVAANRAETVSSVNPVMSKKILTMETAYAKTILLG